MKILKTQTGQSVSVDENDPLYNQYKQGGAQEISAQDMLKGATIKPQAPVKPKSSAYTPGTPITISELNQPQKLADFNTVQTPQVANISGLSFQPMQMTGSEMKAQGYSDKLTDLNKLLYGESAYRANQEDAQGMDKLLKTQNDLTNRFNAIKAQQDMIPLQIQQESAGRARTAAGIAPIETGRLRNNAIDALTTGALLQASQGNISTAQTLIDRAVAQEFDPIKEQIAIVEKNLKIIKDSPLYSLEDKNRAEQQLAIQEQKRAEIAQQEADRKEKLGIAGEAAKYGATSEEIIGVSQAETIEEALALAAPYLSRDYLDKRSDVEFGKDQQLFENSLATGEFNLKKFQIEEDLKQRAFDNGLAVEELTLKRNMFDTDTEFRNAELVLERLKMGADIEYTNAQIDKLYNEMLAEPDPLEQEKKALEIEKLKGDINEKKVEQDKAKIAAGNSLEVVNDKLDLINNILNDTTGIDSVVGPNAWARSKLLNPTDRITGKGANFVANIDMLTDQATLDSLASLKARGGTLGAVSEKELAILQNSATKFKSWEKIDENGRKTYEVSEKIFIEEVKRIKASTERLQKALKESTGTGKYNSIDQFLKDASDEQIDAADAIKNEFPDLSDDDLLELINEQSFSQVGSDTNKATFKKLAEKKVGQKGGQCGRFVNQLTGLGVGDSYQSKMSKMDPTIKTPEPGMVFTMPTSTQYGHTGFIVAVKGDKAIVKDSNWDLDEKVKTHEIPISKMTGFARV